MADPHQVWIGLTTVGSREQAQILARSLVEERLVACAQIGVGITSHFRWEESLGSEAEVPVLLKFPKDRLHALRERLKRLHPYETPEWLAWPVTEASPEYAQWVVEETRPRE